MLTMTNATKALIIAAANSVLGVLSAFKLGHLTTDEKASIIVAVNANLALITALTFKASAKRVPDPAPAPPTVLAPPAAALPPQVP